MPEPIDMLRLLRSAKKTIDAQTETGGTLTSIKKVFLGPAHNPAVYPVISVLPVEELPIEIWNGLIETNRRIKIEAFSHKKKSKDSMRASMGIIEQVKDLFITKADAWLMPDPDTDVNMLYDSIIGETVPGSNPVPYRNGFISSASIIINCFSKDELHYNIDGTSASSLSETDAKTIVDTLLATFKSYQTGAEDFLSSTKSFKSFTLPPVPVYPVLFVGIESESRVHKYTGRDAVNRSVNVYAISKLLSRESSLRQNLTMIDLCRRIFFANKDLGGIVNHYDYRGIVYGQLTVNNELLYGSSLNIDLDCIEALPTES